MARSTSAVQHRPLYRISVSREGWPGGADELAEALALRFSQVAVRVRHELQRTGRYDVPGLGSLSDAQRVVSELLAEGVAAVVIEVRDAADNASPTGDATFLVAASETAVDSPAAEPRRHPVDDRTLLGMGRDDPDSQTFVAGRGPGVIPDLGASGEGSQEIPVAWRVAAGPGQSSRAASAPPVAPAVSAPSVVNRIEEPAARGWSAVLGRAFQDRLHQAEPSQLPDATGMLGPEESSMASRPEQPASADLAAVGIVDDNAQTQMVRPKPRAPDAPAPLRERRFERLRPPEPEVAASAHSPVVAGLWSVLAPGAGQAYNGDLQRGITFALSGLFVIPWFYSIFDAVSRAADLRSRGRIPRSAPWKPRVILVLGFWCGAVVLLAAGSLLVRALEDPPARSAPEEVASSVPTVRPVAQARPAATIEEPAGDESPAEIRAAERREVSAILEIAAVACAEARYLECRRLTEQALEIDDSSRDAQRMHAQAIAGVFAVDMAEVVADPSDGSAQNPVGDPALRKEASTP